MDITNYLKAGYPLIQIITQEPDRATHSIKAEGWKTHSWDCLRGITEPDTGRTLEDISDPLQALKWLGGKGDTVLICQNFHHFITSVEIIQ